MHASAVASPTGRSTRSRPPMLAKNRRLHVWARVPLYAGKKVRLEFVPPGSIDITVYEKDGSARTSSLKWE